MIIMTGMDWILRSFTPVRSGHQSVLTKALCNKRGGQRYWLPRVNISKSLSLPFFFFQPRLYPSIIFLPLSLSPSLLLSDLPPSASTYALSIPHPVSVNPPLPLSNNLFIADLFILYSSSLGTVRADCTLLDLSNKLLSSFLYTVSEPSSSSSSSSSRRYLGAGGVTLVQSNTVLIPLDN